MVAAAHAYALPRGRVDISVFGSAARGSVNGIGSNRSSAGYQALALRQACYISKISGRLSINVWLATSAALVCGSACWATRRHQMKSGNNGISALSGEKKTLNNGKHVENNQSGMARKTAK
jgi:hypothetical protein